jgi:hypothetical protein
MEWLTTRYTWVFDIHSPFLEISKLLFHIINMIKVLPVAAAISNYKKLTVNWRWAMGSNIADVCLFFCHPLAMAYCRRMLLVLVKQVVICALERRQDSLAWCRDTYSWKMCLVSLTPPATTTAHQKAYLPATYDWSITWQSCPKSQKCFLMTCPKKPRSASFQSLYCLVHPQTTLINYWAVFWLLKS